MRAGSEQHHAEEGEGAVLAIDRDELARGKLGLRCPAAKARKCVGKRKWLAVSGSVHRLVGSGVKSVH